MEKTGLLWSITLVIALASCQAQVQRQPEVGLTPQPPPSASQAETRLTDPATSIPSPGADIEPADQPAAVAGLQLALDDPDWNGENIPAGEQCRRFGGDNPSTPRISVADIPAGTDAIVLEFSDRTYSPMDDGGHGKIGYRIEGNANEVIIPSIPGHTFDLPDEFFIVHEHLAPSFDTAGAYMPPCSGGAGNAYYVTVKAVEVISADGKQFNVLDQGTLELGKY